MTWQVVDLLRARVPAISWHPGRIALVLIDHPGPDPVAIAGRCADWIAFHARRVDDGPATFRRFMEQAGREHTPTEREERDGRRDLTTYDRFIG